LALADVAACPMLLPIILFMMLLAVIPLGIIIAAFGIDAKRRLGRE
jgi:hypothetical protein